jgi:cysteine-rich repeat protein
MIRFSARTNKFLAVVALLTGASAVNCSKGGGTSENAGTVKLGLTLPDATTLSSVAYKVFASDGTTVLASGTINTSDKGATPSVDVSVIASLQDTVNLHGTTSANVVCDGTSLKFDVAKGGTTMIGVNLVCGGSQNTTGSGSLIVNGTVILGNNCPVLQTWMASPLTTSTAGQIDVSASATDIDTTMGTPLQHLSYAWTATAGTFVDPTMATTKYNCSVAGAQTLTVTVSDDYTPTPCKATMTFPVTCVSLTCGNGVLDTGEQCDSTAPTDPNKNNCDANCHLICGNGKLDPGEQCDPPVTGICSATCQFVPPMCGDGILQHGEQCDPPNGTTCSSTCTTIVMDPPDLSAACQTCENTQIALANATACSDPTAFFTGGQTQHFGCLGFASGTPQTTCFSLLSCLRTSHCNGINGLGPDDFSDCFCGSLTSVQCLQMGGSTTAACYSQYNAANAAVPIAGSDVTTLFVDPRSPVGIADNIVKCDVQGGCNTTATCGAF